MTWTTGRWRTIKIKEPDNAAAELRDFFASNPPPANGVFHLLFIMGDYQSSVEIDTHHPVTCSVVDHLNGRAIINSLQKGLSDGLKVVFPHSTMNQIIDVTGDMARKAMFAAIARGKPYTNQWNEITPDTAIKLITENREALAKPVVSMTEKEKVIEVSAVTPRNESAGSLWNRQQAPVSENLPKNNQQSSANIFRRK